MKSATNSWTVSFAIILAATLSASSGHAAAAEAPPAVVTEYAFTATVQVADPLVVDQTPDGVRRYIPIVGGTVSGPHFKGTVVAAGGDSQLIRSDGVLVIEARYLIKTDDNVLISVVNRGLRKASPAVMARMLKGEHVGRDEYYFRTVAQFEAPLNSPYADLNSALFVATAEREPHAAIIHFYRVL